MTQTVNFNELSEEVGSMLLACNEAIQQGVLIERQSRQDKEFPFQNWFKARLEQRKIDFDEPGRNFKRG